MSEYTHPNRPGYASERFGASSPSAHEDLDTARKAAEALFAPKGSIPEPSPDATGSMQQNARKPRILSAVREHLPVLQVTHRERTKPRRAEHKTIKPRKRVPVSRLARVRTWLKYGMTVDQAAHVCGVSISEIERILQKA